MPYVNIKITKEDLTSLQKKELITGVTNLLEKVLEPIKRTTIVIIEEIDMDNWGLEGEQVTERRKRKN